MKPRNKDVFMIHNRESGEAQGVYSRAYHDEYEFGSAESARNANCHDVYLDKNKYRIAKYRVTYELIDEDAPADNEVIPEPVDPRDAELDPISAYVMGRLRKAIEAGINGEPDIN